jgi:hypothetical protein
VAGEQDPKGERVEVRGLTLAEVQRSSRACKLFLDSQCPYTCLDVVRPVVARIGELANDHTALDLGCFDALLHRFGEFYDQQQLGAIFEEGFCGWSGEPGSANANIPAAQVGFRSNGSYISSCECLLFNSFNIVETCYP